MTRPMDIADATEWQEKIARFLWDLVAEYDDVPNWNESANVELKSKYLKAAGITCEIMAIIMHEPEELKQCQNLPKWLKSLCYQRSRVIRRGDICN